MLEDLGTKLKILRNNQNYTRKQVSELIGVSVSQIAFYENNDRLPSLVSLIKLATLYKVSTDYLLDCNSSNKNTLSLDGLTNEQVKALKLTADCFRNKNMK